MIKRYINWSRKQVRISLSVFENLPGNQYLEFDLKPLQKGGRCFKPSANIQGGVEQAKDYTIGQGKYGK